MENICNNLNHTQGSTACENLKIKYGIFQGNSLHPLLFCLALVPLSCKLKQTGHGYDIYEWKINHLFYMDDLKLYGKNGEELEGFFTTLKIFSDGIGMEFGLDKCG